MKLGIVGTGLIAQEVIPLLPACGITATALCGTPRSAELVGSLADEHGIAGRFCDFAKMLAEGDVDTVYVAVPNFLHFPFVRQALLAGKHVIVEKPMTSNDKEASELAALAKEKGLFLFEAITTVHLANFAKLREWLPRIGTVKLVSCNFSQYSRRYDAFRKGEVLPAFDPAKSGGAMMDLNLYNLHYLLGLFGEPETVTYTPNVERAIDTSGVLVLTYDGFVAVSIAAKDCAAPASYVIQGTAGYLSQSTTANLCGAVTLHLNDGTEEVFDETPESRLMPEFVAFKNAIESGDSALCERLLAHSLAVSRVQTRARMGAGIVFPADA